VWFKVSCFGISDKNLATGWLADTAKKIEKRCFTGTIWSDYAKSFIWRDVQGDSVKNLSATDVKGKILNA
jgi:hypothetical protein